MSTTSRFKHLHFVDSFPLLGKLLKFVAKLRLLDHGLLIEARTLDDLHAKVNRSSKDGEDEDSDGDGEGHESYEDFEKRVNILVAVQLKQASSSKRDHYKDGLVYQERKIVIQDFIKTASVRKCHNANCGA